MIPSRLWVAVLCLSFILSVHAKESDEAKATLDSLVAEATVLRPKKFHFGPPYPFPKSLTLQVKQLREKVQAYTKEHSDEDLGIDWHIAIDRSFILSSITEWDSQPAAEEGLRQWWKLIEESQTDERKKAGRILQLTMTHLRNWAKAEPEASRRVLDEAQARFDAAAPRRDREQWVDSREYSKSASRKRLRSFRPLGVRRLNRRRQGTFSKPGPTNQFLFRGERTP